MTVRDSQEGSETRGSDLCVEGALAVSMADKRAGPPGGDRGPVGWVASWAMLGCSRVSVFLISEPHSIIQI